MFYIIFCFHFCEKKKSVEAEQIADEMQNLFELSICEALICHGIRNIPIHSMCGSILLTGMMELIELNGNDETKTMYVLVDLNKSYSF